MQEIAIESLSTGRLAMLKQPLGEKQGHMADQAMSRWDCSRKVPLVEFVQGAAQVNLIQTLRQNQAEGICGPRIKGHIEQVVDQETDPIRNCNQETSKVTIGDAAPQCTQSSEDLSVQQILTVRSIANLLRVVE